MLSVNLPTPSVLQANQGGGGDHTHLGIFEGGGEQVATRHANGSAGNHIAPVVLIARHATVGGNAR
jgi:hypothetical protein